MFPTKITKNYCKLKIDIIFLYSVDYSIFIISFVLVGSSLLFKDITELLQLIRRRPLILGLFNFNRIMSFESFELIGDFKVKCKTCGEEMPTGIFSISKHWTECTGKGFTENLLTLASQKEGKLTVEDIEKLQGKHLKY